MRTHDKKKNMANANLLAEQRYLESKGLLNEGVVEEAQYAIEKVNALIKKNPQVVLEMHNEGKAFLYKFDSLVTFDVEQTWVQYEYELSYDEGQTFKKEKKSRNLSNPDRMGTMTAMDTFRNDMNIIKASLENEMYDGKATDITNDDNLRAIPKTINYNG
jgi:hypothetical protein